MTCNKDKDTEKCVDEDTEKCGMSETRQCGKLWCIKMGVEFEQVVVHNKMGGEFNGEIVTMTTTHRNVSMRTQKNVACRKHTIVASCGA